MSSVHTGGRLGRTGDDLSTLIASSCASQRTRVAFGNEGQAIPAAELLDCGRRLFGPAGESAAVGALLTNDRATVQIVLGALAAGVRVVSLPLPGRGAVLAEYMGSMKDICETQGLMEVVAADEFAELLETVGVPVRRHSELMWRPLAAPSGNGFELVQFTSGSTGPPRAVMLRDEQLGVNVEAILSIVAPRPRDVVVSWLPLSHDMGLVGMLLAGLAGGGPRFAGMADVVLLDPRDFLRRPGVWVETLSRWRGCFTAAPDFGYRVATRRGPSGEVDLSALRCAIVGGEIVRGDTLRRFGAAFSNHGFDPVGLCPAYGMAEVGVGVAFTPPAEHWRERVVTPASLADGAVVEPVAGEPELALVSSGPPLPGYTVEVGDSDWGDVSGFVGTLVLSGPSLGADGATRVGLGGEDGAFRTGDRGFVDDGWVYVCGRTDDYLVVNGRNIFAPVVEAAVGEVEGVRAGRVTAVGLPGGDWAVVVERSSRDGWDAALADRVRRDVQRVSVEAAGVRPNDVVVVAPGGLPLTSSGKLQRHRVQIGLLKGEVGAGGWAEDGEG